MVESAHQPRVRPEPCGCFCHEELGGGVHPGQRCVCNGGPGWSDL